MKICHLCLEKFDPLFEDDDVCNKCIVKTCKNLLSKIPIKYIEINES